MFRPGQTVGHRGRLEGEWGRQVGVSDDERDGLGEGVWESRSEVGLRWRCRYEGPEVNWFCGRLGVRRGGGRRSRKITSSDNLSIETQNTKCTYILYISKRINETKTQTTSFFETSTKLVCREWRILSLTDLISLDTKVVKDLWKHTRQMRNRNQTSRTNWSYVVFRDIRATTEKSSSPTKHPHQIGSRTHLHRDPWAICVWKGTSH